ncbi:MAG: hypothetical protein KC619_00635 [Myxococcales bacterium]|nr:hypothetical protein [Myxococcales bacterium]
MSARLAPVFLLLLAALGCDGTTVEDAGPPASGVILTATGVSERDSINGVAPRMGFKYYLIDVTIEARGVGPISIAPFAFEVALADGTRITADSRTNELADGCTSQSIPVDGMVACRLAFSPLVDAPAPATVRWTDGSRSASAMVPPL